MKLYMGQMKNGKYSVYIGKGSLHLYFPNETETVSDLTKSHWHFEGGMRVVGGMVFLEGGTGFYKDDFKCLSKERSTRFLQYVQSFEVYYKSNRGYVKIMVF